VYVLADPLGTLRQARNEHRLRTATELLTLLQNNPGAAQAGQLGTATEGCQVSSDFCQIDTPSCANLTKLLPLAEQTLPADMSWGTNARTGFAISFPTAETIAVTACYSEGTEKIVAEGEVDPTNNNENPL